MERFAALRSRLWVDRKVLHVAFVDGDPRNQEFVRDLIVGPHGWNNVSGLQFVFDDRADAEIRISFERGGSWSHLGNNALLVKPPWPTMNLGFAPEDGERHKQRPTLHEFGHACGLDHEPKSPLAGELNIEAVYAYYLRQYGGNRAIIEANYIRRLADDDTVALGEDGNSIMQPVMDGSLYQDGETRPGSDFISVVDAYGMELLYGPPPAPWHSVILPFAARS